MGALGALIWAGKGCRGLCSSRRWTARPAGVARAVHPDQLDRVQLRVQCERCIWVERDWHSGRRLKLLIVVVLVFILGMFIDFFEITFIIDSAAGAGG
jgi:hypothetical protein